MIGAAVSSPQSVMPIRDYGLEVSSWRYLRNLFRPAARREHLPNVLQVLARSMEFGGVANRHLTARLADLYLCPPLEHFDRFNFRPSAEIAEAAYHYALPRITAWRDRNGFRR